jgi:holo-[acyl-carrier protein] synthase
VTRTNQPQARLTCGVDLVDIAAFGRALVVTRGRMASMCFTEREQEEAKGRVDRLATRWAVKEAVAKALGTGLMQGVGFRDIEVAVGQVGAPALALLGEAQRLATDRRLVDWAISVSHERGLAIAFVIASQQSGSGSASSSKEE